MTELFAKLNKVEPNKGLITLQLSTDDIHTLERYHASGQQQVVSLIASDANGVSAQQRKFAFALLHDIWFSQVGGYWIETPETVKQHFYAMYEYYNSLDFGEFSLSAAKGTKTDTNQFINMLLDYAAIHDISLSVKPLNELEPQEIARWEYRCLMEKMCVVCGKKPSDLHHLDAVGSGVNRQHTNHLGHRAVQLCREHHNLAHSLGIETFMQRFKINGIKIDEKIALAHGLNMR
ncbi:putative HNHc nuclease [Leuconostoc pseudomesenteroides]|uniref:putative HNHc nuclease n=1 Tax=Leuconostoc pseudomesenteroides TaxID=33968 RepID=UPI00166BC5AE|nr:putative HNHc nuclease [Leuconostoc pseudomesenteroides]